MKKEIETEWKIKLLSKIKEILEDSKDKFNPKDKKLLNENKNPRNKNKCLSPSETLLSNPFQNLPWTIINVKEQHNSNSNTSKHISVRNKNKKSFKSNKTEKSNFSKSNSKSIAIMSKNKKEKILA